MEDEKLLDIKDEFDPSHLDSLVEQDMDFKKVCEGLTPEDNKDGLANIQPPQEFYDQQKAMYEESLKFVELTSDIDLPYRYDQISVKFNAEELLVLTQILEDYISREHRSLEYVTKELKLNIYDQVRYTMDLRDRVNDMLNKYIKLRPFTPFIGSWARRIGRGNVRK